MERILQGAGPFDGSETRLRDLLLLELSRDGAVYHRFLRRWARTCGLISGEVFFYDKMKSRTLCEKRGRNFIDKVGMTNR